MSRSTQKCTTILKTGEKHMENLEKYWIAINGASVVFCPLPAKNPPTVAPTPEQLIGFSTAEEAKHIQEKLLTCPVNEIIPTMRNLRAKWKRGEIGYVTPKTPQPPTDETAVFYHREEQ